MTWEHVPSGERVGAPIPRALYEKVINPNSANYRYRICPTCNASWVTGEVNLSEKLNISPAFCPIERSIAGVRVKSSHHTDSVTARTDISKGVLKVLMLGGIWRRRQCRHCTGCEHYEELHHRQTNGSRHCEKCSCVYTPCTWKDTNKITTWSTGEFSVEGFVWPNIRNCLRCGTKSKFLHHRQQQALQRTLEHWQKKQYGYVRTDFSKYDPLKPAFYPEEDDR